MYLKSAIEKYRKMPIQVKASLWFLVCAFLQKGISALTTPIYTRMLTTVEYGQYNVFSSWQSIINCIVTLNLYGGMYAQGLVKHEGQERDKFISSLQGLTLVLVVGWTIIYALGHAFWNRLFSLTTQHMLLMFIIMWTTAVFNFWSVNQRVELKYKRLVGITLFASLANPILSIILINVLKDKVTARILGTALVEVVIYSFLFIEQVRKGKILFDIDNWKYALTFCIPLIPHYLSQMILNSSDRIMIQRMVDDSSAGIYSLAYSVSMIMSLFNTSLLQTVEPWLYQKMKNNEVDYIKKVAYPSFAFIAIVNLTLIAFAPEVVRIFAPPTYHEAIWVIPPVTMSVFFMFMYSFFALFEFYFEKPNYITVATLTGAALNIILNYIFIKIYGYIAAGYTTLVCYVVYSLMHYIFMCKVLKEKMNGAKVYDMRIIIAISAVFMLLSFLLMMSYNHPIIRYSALAMMIAILAIKHKLVIETGKKIFAIRKAS